MHNINTWLSIERIASVAVFFFKPPTRTQETNKPNDIFTTQRCLTTNHRMRQPPAPRSITSCAPDLCMLWCVVSSVPSSFVCAVLIGSNHTHTNPTLANGLSINLLIKTHCERFRRDATRAHTHNTQVRTSGSIDLRVPPMTVVRNSIPPWFSLFCFDLRAVDLMTAKTKHKTTIYYIQLYSI